MVDSSIWHEFRPGQKVLTREGIAGTVQEVLDGPKAGNETYLVTLDAGLGGGEYGAGELAPLHEPATAAVETAASWYPELTEILVDRPPPATSMPASEYLRTGVKTAGHWVDTDRAARLERIAVELLTEANADRWRPDHEDEASPYVERGDVLANSVGPDEDPCRCCDGAGEHDNGHECTRCDASGRAEGHEVAEPVPCEGKTAGWVTDLLKTPDAEYSYDWCRFRRESHCWYPKGLNEAATREAGYAVWTPVDRGRCPRGSWELQEQCPVGAPGPHSGGFTDATVPWDEGGQQDGAPVHVHAELDKGLTLGSFDGVTHSAAVPSDYPVHHMLPNSPEAGPVLRREIEARRGLGTTSVLRVVAGHYRDAIAKYGGFTVKNHLGDGPATGYMVSPHKDAEEVFPEDSFDDEAVEGYRARHAHQLAHPDAYLGAWHHEGNVYLDVSHHLATEGAAHELARQNDQIAIYDLSRGIEIPTSHAPAQRAAALSGRPTHAMLPAGASAGQIRSALGLDAGVEGRQQDGTNLHGELRDDSALGILNGMTHPAPTPKTATNSEFRPEP